MAGTNWAGNLTYSANSLLVPSTVEEAQEAVRAAGKLRVLGSRHCFNDIADTTGRENEIPLDGWATSFRRWVRFASS